MKIAVLCLAACLFFVPPASSQQHIHGDWQTTIQELGRPVRCVIHINSKAGNLTGTLDYPDRFEFGTALDSIAFQNSALKFRSGLNTFEGSYTSDSQVISGTWSSGAEPQKI